MYHISVFSVKEKCLDDSSGNSLENRLTNSNLFSDFKTNFPKFHSFFQLIFILLNGNIVITKQ